MTIDATPFETRKPPVHASLADERAHVLRRLAGACRIFGRSGFSDGLLGHLTIRDPEFTDCFWVNRVGVSMRHMGVGDLVQVDHEGRILAGRGPVNPAGLLIHTAVHRARPDVMAMCHAHAPHGSTWSSLGRRLDPISQDASVFFERQALILDPEVVRDAAGAARFAALFGAHRVAIHACHGIFTTGASIDEAAWWFMLMNQCCEAQLRAEAVGTPRQLSPEIARWIAGVLGTPVFGWLSFQTLWDELLSTDPDLAG